MSSVIINILSALCFFCVALCIEYIYYKVRDRIERWIKGGKQDEL